MARRDELIAVVEQSPAAVGRHDKAAWVALFADNAQVNDPVGSAPNVGREVIGRFYDTFIAPNTIIFGVEHDIVCGDSVIRDLSIETRMSDHVKLHVPMHLRYDLDADRKIVGLYAYWELPGMIGQLLKRGPLALPVAVKLSAKLMKNQRLSGSLGFAKGFNRVGVAGKELAAVFLDTITSGTNLGVAEAMLGDRPVVKIGEHQGTALSSIGERVAGFRVGKTLAAGDFVTASLFNVADHAVVLLQFQKNEIVGVTLYIED